MTDNPDQGKYLVPVGQSVVQTGNTSSGHLAGRDISVTDVAGDYINILPPIILESRLGQLYRRLKDEVSGDQALSDYIDQLKIFTRSVENEEVIGLDGKFSAAERQDQLDMAKAMKEMIYSQLLQNLFSKTFQTIYATLMAKVWEQFQTHVRPAIVRGDSREQVDFIVNKYVVGKISEELESCTEYEGVATAEVRGMLYFLTGNCHLLWH